MRMRTGTCRRLVAALGKAGWLQPVVPKAYGGRSDTFDVRELCLVRETLARFDGLADFAFAMQGLGTGPISLFGTPELKERYLPPVVRGEKIAAFALTEPQAGSDVAAMRTSAVPDGNDHVRIDGVKTWISNGGIADHYVVFVRSGEAPGARGLSAFVVDADTPGFFIEDRIDVIAPHPLATLRFEGCRVPIANRIGAGGQGFKIAMATLDVFRSTVGAAALGFARRALDEALHQARTRILFDAPLADMQLTQAALAEMALGIDAAALLVYRAAWTKDCGAERVTREAGDGQTFRDGGRANDRRSRRADFRRTRRQEGRSRRAALSRGARPAHLRRGERSAEDRDCTGIAARCRRRAGGLTAGFERGDRHG